ncbi:uncharacterized protein LOC131604386 [Vicia villosa]|uniref:uncharacterized protein LOC131604386 n=1 Tax=Vicia villosa TaxID=3911 RepID=UPI00273C4340|nr:uncharacterized protein LOC131604386 [Vicia villosa]
MVKVKVTSPESPKRHSTGGFFVTISSILTLLTRQASRLRAKAKASPMKDEEWRIDLKAPKSPLARPKELLSSISNKAMLQFGKKKKQGGGRDEEVEGWGNGGVWQKEILMGGKCEPLDFSGVIYYDINGKQTREVPLRSPRASPLPGYLTRR